MTTITSDQLTEIVIGALEKTCFLIADEVDDDQKTGLKTKINRSSRIQYTGTQAGTIYVDTSDGFLQELASCILGSSVEEIDPTEDGVQASLEIANVIAGSIVFALGGDQEDVKLGLPETGDIVDNANAAECFLESAYGVIHVHWHPEVVDVQKVA